MDDIFEPKNSKICKKIQFDKDEEHERIEIEQRKETAERLMKEIAEIRSGKKQKDGEFSEDIKLKLKKKEKDLEFVRLEPMNEKIFFKKEDEFEDDGGYQYNRPIHKNGLLDDYQCPPYERFPLFKKSKNSEKLSLHRVGEPIGAVLKATVNIKEYISDESDTPDAETMKWDFNFFHPIFQRNSLLIDKFVNIDVAVRVYLLRGLSLCAVDNASDLPAFAAGLEALSSANSYPEIQVGETQVR